MSKYRLVGGIRLGKEKPYWINQLELFANAVTGDNNPRIEIGKQDSRGVPSISLYNDSHCITHQQHFNTTKELLAFIQGYNMASGASFNNFYDRGVGPK